jgi:hypothetical protein
MTWDAAKMSAAPSTGTEPETVVHTSTAATIEHAATIDIEHDVIVLPDARPGHLALVPEPVATTSVPEQAAPARAAEPHAPPLVTRLVGLGLVGIAVAIAMSAMAHNHAASTALRHAEVSRPAEAAVPDLPTVAAVIGAARNGDVISLALDPAGSAGRVTLVLAPNATVLLTHPIGALTAGTALSLQTFLDTMSTDVTAVRAATFRLRYDNTGQVVALTQA